eukprot:350339-Chlamydomonas_euryale.AAC.1
MVALSALLTTGVLHWDDCLTYSSAWDTLVWWVLTRVWWKLTRESSGVVWSKCGWRRCGWWNCGVEDVRRQGTSRCDSGRQRCRILPSHMAAP